MVSDEGDRTNSFTVLAAGTVVSHYKIISKIGSGGMGEVYLAEDTELKRQVALKFLPHQFVFDENAKSRFKREAQAVAKLNHPNVVTVHEVSDFSGRPFIVMEHVGDQVLGDFFKKKDCTFDKVVKLAIQICKGLEAAHSAGIVHRDIKPSNILIDRTGRLKLVDFGLATIAGSDKLTKTGSTLGTIGYMSPEQVKGIATDNRSDIFSFGVILYEMLTCRNPFKKDGEAATLKAILDDTPEPLARFKSDLPEEIQGIVSKTLEKNPDNRYQHVDDIIVDLQKMAHSSKPEIIPFNRSKTPPIIAFGLIFAIIIVGGYFIYNLNLKSKSSPIEVTAGSQWQNSIAVLPFRDFSPQKDQEYFCDGMTDVIIGKLSQLKDLKIISMSSVMRYKNLDRNLKEIGQKLNVATILEGSIQKEEGRVRITTQLINVADDTHLWSQTFDKELQSIFSIQDEISREIVDAMKITLLCEDETSFAKHYTDNLEAYDYYLRGRFFWNRRTEESLLKAIEYFDKAIKLDSNFALAYSGLADAYSVLPDYSDYLDTETMPIAKEAAQKALALDDNLAEAHTSLGFVLQVEKDYEDAEKEFLIAIELNPGYATAHQWYSLMLDDMNRTDEALKEIEIAYDLDPLSVVIHINLANKRCEFWDWSGAEKIFKRALEIDPNRGNIYGWYTLMLLRQGRFDEALQMVERTGQLMPGMTNTILIEGIYYYYNRQYDEAIDKLNKAVTLDSTNVITCLHLGQSYLAKEMYTEAKREFESDVILSSPWGDLFIYLIYAYEGKKDKVQDYLNNIENNPDDRIVSSTAVAGLYALIGDENKTFEWLNKAYEEHDFYLTFIKVMRDFDNYKSDSRYIALLEKMGLPQ